MTIVWLLHVQVVLTLRHLHACFVASTLHPSFGIQASNFDHIKPPLRAVVAGFVASKLRNPSLELRLHQTSMPASSHQHSIQALEFVASKLQLRRIHLTSKHPSCIQAAESKLRFQASIFNLCGNRCARSAITFVLYTLKGNDGLSLGACARSLLIEFIGL